MTILSPFTGNLSTDSPGTFSANPITLAASGDNFQINFAGYTDTTTGVTQVSKVVTLQGTNTNGGNFSGTGTITFQHKRYWGTHPGNALPTDTAIINANGAGVGTGSQFATSRVKNYDGISGGGTNHLFFAFPASFGDPTFVINGLQNDSFTEYTTSFENDSGHIEDYVVWVSNTPYGTVSQFDIE